MRIFLAFVIIVSLLSFTGCNSSKDNKNMNTAKLIFSIGDVKVKSNGNWVVAQEEMNLTQGDEIKTGFNSECNIVIGEASTLAIKEKTHFSIKSILKNSAGNETNVFALDTGKAIISPKKLLKGDSFRVQTPTAIAAVRGTKFSVATSKTGKLKVAVVDGKVSLKRRIPALEKTDENIIKKSETLNKLNKKIESEAVVISANQSAFIDNIKAYKENKIVEKAIEKKIASVDEVKDKSSEKKQEVEKVEEDELALAISSLNVAKKNEDKSLEQVDIVITEAVSKEDVEDIKKLQKVIEKQKAKKIEKTEVVQNKEYKFVINSNKNSLIYVDSKIVGKGSATIKFQDNKKVTIKILSKGYEDYLTEKNLVIGKNKIFTPELMKSGVLKIVTPFKRSRIYVNSRYIGKGAVSLKPGSKKNLLIEVKAKGFELYSTEFSLKKGEDKTLEVAMTGKPLDRFKWQKKYGKSIVATPIYYKKQLYVVTKKGKLISMDLNGKKIWSKSLKGMTESKPFILNNRIYIVTKNGYFSSIKTRTGKVAWNKKIYGSLLFGSAPIVANKNIILATSLGRIYSYSEKGNENWKIDLENGIYSSPAYKNGKVFVALEDNNLYAIDSNNGEIEWKFQLDDRVVSSSPVISKGTIFIGTYSGSFYAIDLEEGEKVWSNKTGASILSTPSVKGNRVFVGSNDGYLYCFNTKTGDSFWKFKAASKKISKPVLVANKVFISSGKSVYALNQKDGKKYWVYDFKVNIKTGPKVVGNNIFIGLSTGEIASVRDSLINIYK